MAGFGSEVMALLTYATYALGSAVADAPVLFALAALPYVVLAVFWR
jgi:hypothetical protein